MGGSAMIQVRKTSAEACSTDNAKQVPLTDAGFQQISKSCCYEDVKASRGGSLTTWA